jgi:hypothetical protein
MTLPPTPVLATLAAILVLLVVCSRSAPPRLWFWFSLLLISLVVGLLQSLARRP